ncbi:M56 family metallopeptidase [Arsukibacterium sp.]|uniref:M56 family metallopeptidase n=1 Tax=Arsukibacterium sp. TaxID=1977258 RepID=UPI00299EA2E7|nr:M56 family metallopeptidase [Arsukibacterium sp.]MDX1537240.1 M56 family metallopeptidase [Arsukibacterium sp.]
MLVGDLAIVLNLLSIAVLAFAISVVLLCISFRAILNRLAHFTFGLRKAILWALVSAPWWIAAGCVAVLWPGQPDIFAATWLSGLAHWHHVDLFSFTSWHAITLFSAVAYATWSIARNVFYRRKQASAMAALLSLSDIKPATTTAQCRYYSLALSVPTAFTAGLIRPRIFVTTALQQQVNPQQLDIIVRHEMAHVTARDPLFKTVFAAVACFYPAGTARSLITQFTLLTEQIADRAATDAYDNLDVAQTLIDVARLQRNLNFGNKSAHCDGVASYFGNDQTSVRVQYLINPALSTSRSAIVLALLLFSCSPLLVASTVDSLHHFIETFITH